MAAENETKPAAKKVIFLTAECAENAEFLILSFPPRIPASWCGVNSSGNLFFPFILISSLRSQRSLPAPVVAQAQVRLIFSRFLSSFKIDVAIRQLYKYNICYG